MSDIFVSYSKADRGKAEDIAAALKQQGYSVWWDRRILPGETLDTVIETALDAAKCVIVLWSRTSVASKWVKAEASEGDRRGILVPVLIDDVQIPQIPLAFRHIQAADLRDWDGTLPHPEFDNLLKAVARILGRPQAVQPGQKPKEVRDAATEKVHSSIDEREKLANQGNSIGMKFTLIPAGEFFMGSEEHNRAKPVHTVKITNPFFLGTYPVTQREWKAVMGDNPSRFMGDNLPVENVSWREVLEFTRKLNAKEGTDKYRLPSEAEWEYACRAGTTTRNSFGDSESKLGEYAWFKENSGDKTHPVGQKKPNSWGLYDMHGNVWEWVQDTWHDSYEGAPTDGSAWEGFGSYRVVRGGCWEFGAGNCSSASRTYDDPDRRNSDLGFRLVRSA
jgi:formylglycine-generating enzyme required for sulfatase activity